MDNEETECFDVSFVKARAKNIVESNILCKQLKNIDRQCRRSVSKLESELREERRFAFRLKREVNVYRKKDKDLRDRTDEKLWAMEKLRKTAPGKVRKSVWDVNDTVDKEDEDMSVMGQGMRKETPCQPKMFFWSQDSSTKLPVVTSFYGYRMNLQRSMTEVKLLGQQMYPVVRETQSAEPFAARSTTITNIQRAKTSAMPANGISDNLFDEDFCYEALKRAPPPTRENTNMSEVRPTSGMLTRNNSSLTAPDARTRANTSEMKRNEKLGNEGNVKENEKVYMSELNFIEKPYTSEGIHRTFSRVQDTHTEKSTPENINLDMKQVEGHDNLPQISHRSVGTAKGSIRPPKKRVARLNIKTRAEATKQYQAVVMKKSGEKAKDLTELEQTYSHIPSLMTEINRLQTTIEFLPKGNTGQYSKSAFGVSMQSAISKKVLNKTSLPAAFRKNNNTMLKHYGGPFMEVRATKITTAAAPVSAE